MKKISKLLTGRPSKLKIQHYKKVAQSFKRMIRNGSWPEEFVLPSQIKLATTFQVGELTVRRALTCLAEEQCIVKNVRRQWIVRNPDHFVSLQGNGIVLIASRSIKTFWESADWFRIRKGIECSIPGKCQFRIYFKNGNNAIMHTALLPGLKDADIRGILLLGHFSKNCLQQYSMLNLPVVRVDAPSTIPQLASVSVDNVAAAEDAVCRLAELGHRKIALCRYMVTIKVLSDIDPDSVERQAGFLAGLKKCGLRGGKQDIFSHFEGDNTAMMNAILTAHPRYTAVLCVGAGQARAISKAALAAGLVLPRDLSLVAFDGLESSSRFSGPRIDFENIGRKAMELLESRQVRHVHIPTSWHEGSTLTKAP
jgi:DNA-binding LacI/PurR family transcriptional regulator/DNA-binding transcriptional regulator YhcF (GntR family)